VPGRGGSWIAKRALVYLLLLGVCLLFFVPFIWTVTTSLKTLPDSVNANLIPTVWTTSAWREIFSQYDFALFIRNSLFLAVVITAANIFLGGLGGYAFARLKFPGRELLFFVVLGTLMVPDQLRLIPVFVMLVKWGLYGHFTGYILINLVTATNLFFMRQYFLTIPKDFEEAAKLDGAGYFKTFWRVMLPLALPAIAALTILQFQGTWNDFFWPLIIFGQGNPHLYTVQLGLAELVLTYNTNWPELMAGSLIAIAPILLIFLVFQRYFIAGVVAAGVKG
jgi:multiple sugar transport system permease protein